MEGKKVVLRNKRNQRKMHEKKERWKIEKYIIE